ncbi:DUF4192 domain-containing protein [Actinoplanes sp. NBC_00393]|uniref:DUF4192 domain-containing protein n=1 Tax=Actinoplanes sp. NBC_00393 TaxID=2975953 RepID=UPI002E230516
MNHPERLDLNHPADLAAIVPYLLGYHPRNQLAILALRGTSVLFAAATPLPYSDPSEDGTAVAVRIAAHGPERVLLIGYGDHETVTIAVTHTTDAFTILGVTVPVALRVHDDRLWHLACGSPEHQSSGIPFDPSTTAAAARATYLGLTAAQDIDTLATRLGPITGAERDAMNSALAAARQHLDELAAGTTGVVRSRLRSLLDDLLHEALSTYRQHDRLPDDRAALLLTLLTVASLRDDVLEQVHGNDVDIDLWTDLTRRADPDRTAAPATLLSLAALQRGSGVLARLAIERAREADPNDSLIQTVVDAIACGIDPAVVHRLLHE